MITSRFEPSEFTLYKVLSGIFHSQVRVGELFRSAICKNAPAIVVAHCHPSGDLTPSPDDVAVTRAIVQAGKLMDVDLVDHLVGARAGYVSLRERGLGFG
ncbi:MAG: JAB domain-containing protein [Chloroflexota bacterium]